MGGAEEEGVGGPDQLQVFWAEAASSVGVRRLRGRSSGPRSPGLNVLGAVAVGLLHSNQQMPVADTAQCSVDPQPSPGWEVDDYSDLLAGRHCVERKTGCDGSGDPQNVGSRHV